MGDNCFFCCSNKRCTSICDSRGVLAKLIKYRFDKEIIQKLLELKWWNFEENELIRIIPLLQSENFSKNI